MDIIIKRFTVLINKFGNFSESFAKFDVSNSGAVGLAEFRNTNKKYQLNFNPAEVDLLFKALVNSDNLSVNRKF